MQGWVCPWCDRAWEPWIATCPNCGPATFSVTFAEPYEVFAFPPNVVWGI